MTPKASLIALACLTLAACGQQPAASGGDPYAGLDGQIRTWRADLEAGNPQCADKVAGKGCEAFEVTCKGARDLTADDQAKGVTAKVVAAMTFRSTSDLEGAGKPGSAFAEFVRTGEAWTRTETTGVNLTTCAQF